MRQMGRNLVGTLATGYILCLFSERLFWTAWRPSDSVGDLAVTWLAYSAIAYLFLTVVRWSRADDFWSVFLAGAVYGWLVEGGLAYTLYGTEASAPFPISISVTGLSWHALITVMVGWWATGKALSAAPLAPIVWVSIGVGFFWGMWGMFPRQESPPILTAASAFFANAFVLTLGAIAAWWAIFRTRLDEFRPGRMGIALCTAIIGLFYAQHVAALGVRPLLMLPALLCTALIPLFLRRRRMGTAKAGVFDGECDARLIAARLPILALVPLVATATYATAVSLRLDRLPIAEVVYLVTGIAGVVTFLAAIVATASRSASIKLSARANEVSPRD